MKRIAIACVLAACGGAQLPATPETASARCTREIGELTSLASQRRTAADRSAIDQRAHVLTEALASDDACREAIAAFASASGQRNHRAWSDHHKAAAFTAADDSYQLELEVLPDAPTAARDELYRADLWYARAQAEQGDAAIASYRTAATLFESTVTHGKVSPADVTEAAYAAALSRKTIWEADPENATQDDDSDLQFAVALPFPAQAAAMIAAFHAYAATLHGGTRPELIAMSYLEARLDLRFHHVDDAIAKLREVVDEHRDVEEAPYAAALLFDVYTRAHRDGDRAAFAEELALTRAWLDANPELETIVDAVTAHH